MAQSRLERIGTIFTRISSLMKGGAMKTEDKPLWYDIYQAFPPKLEPRFDRAAPNMPVRDIFYKEDVVRARFQREHPKFITNFANQSFVSETQKFLAIYNDIEKTGAPESEIYEKALEQWKQQSVEAREERLAQRKENTNQKSEKQTADSEAKPSVKLSDIFNQEKKE